MGLEDRIKEANDISVLSQLVATLEHGDNIPVPIMNGFADYVARTEEDRGSEVLARYVGRLRNNPEALYRVAKSYQKSESERFDKAMGKDAKTMVGKLKEHSLRKLAESLPDKSKAYLDIQRALAEDKKDVIGALEICAKQFKIKANQELVMSLYEYPELARDFLEHYMAFQAEKFYQNKLAKKIVKDGETEYKLDRDKAEEYVVKTLGSYKGSQRTQHNIGLVGLYQHDMAA